MSDRLEQRCYDAFTKQFEEELPETHSAKVAFHRVNDRIEKAAGFKPYKSYNSYKNVRCRKNKGGH